VKQVGFKPGVKERERTMDKQSGESEKCWVKELVSWKWRNWYISDKQ